MAPLFELHLIQQGFGFSDQRISHYTRVSKAVFPAPLGPTSKKEGKVEEDVER